MVEIEILVTLCTLPQQLFVFTKKTCLKNTHIRFQDECHVCIVVATNISHQKITCKKPMRFQDECVVCIIVVVVFLQKTTTPSNKKITLKWKM